MCIPLTVPLCRTTSETALLEVAARNTVPGAVLTVGEGDTGQLGLGPDTMDCKRVKLVPRLERDVVDVYAGGMHTLCLTKDGKVGCETASETDILVTSSLASSSGSFGRFISARGREFSLGTKSNLS